MAGDKHQPPRERWTRVRRFLLPFRRPTSCSPIAPNGTTTELTSNESEAICSVCRNLDFHCPVLPERAEVSLDDKSSIITFSRGFSEFESQADLGCPFCWVLASIGRLWNDKTRLYVSLAVGCDPLVRCTKHETSISIYIPKSDALCEPPTPSMPLLLAGTIY